MNIQQQPFIPLNPNASQEIKAPEQAVK